MPCVSRCLASPQHPSDVTTTEINVPSRKSAGSMCVLITPHLCTCVYVHAGVPAHLCTRVHVHRLFLEGGGERKKVRKQQNKLRDNEESNTGTCFHWCGGRNKSLLRCCTPSTVFQGNGTRTITFIPASNLPYTHFLPNTYEPVFWAQLCGQMSKLT